jgi:hypothetical protein
MGQPDSAVPVIHCLTKVSGAVLYHGSRPSCVLPNPKSPRARKGQMVRGSEPEAVRDTISGTAVARELTKARGAFALLAMTENPPV